MLCGEAAMKITTRGPVLEGRCFGKVEDLCSVSSRDFFLIYFFFTWFLNTHINRISRDSHMDNAKFHGISFMYVGFALRGVLPYDLFSFHHHSRGWDFTNEPGSALSVFCDSTAGTSKAIHCIKSNLLYTLDNTKRLTKSYFFPVRLLPGLPGTVHV